MWLGPFFIPYGGLMMKLEKIIAKVRDMAVRLERAALDLNMRSQIVSRATRATALKYAASDLIAVGIRTLNHLGWRVRVVGDEIIVVPTKASNGRVTYKAIVPSNMPEPINAGRVNLGHPNCRCPVGIVGIDLGSIDSESRTVNSVYVPNQGMVIIDDPVKPTPTTNHTSPAMQTQFDATIGGLDRVLSELMGYAKSNLDQANVQTLKHHIEDMELCAGSIRKRLKLGPNSQLPQCAPAVPVVAKMRDAWAVSNAEEYMAVLSKRMAAMPGSPSVAAAVEYYESHHGPMSLAPAIDGMQLQAEVAGRCIFCNPSRCRGPVDCSPENQNPAPAHEGWPPAPTSVAAENAKAAIEKQAALVANATATLPKTAWRSMPITVTVPLEVAKAIANVDETMEEMGIPLPPPDLGDYAAVWNGLQALTTPGNPLAALAGVPMAEFPTRLGEWVSGFEEYPYNHGSELEAAVKEMLDAIAYQDDRLVGVMYQAHEKLKAAYQNLPTGEASPTLREYANFWMGLRELLMQPGKPCHGLAPVPIAEVPQALYDFIADLQMRLEMETARAHGLGLLSQRLTKQVGQRFTHDASTTHEGPTVWLNSKKVAWEMWCGLHLGWVSWCADEFLAGDEAMKLDETATSIWSNGGGGVLAILAERQHQLDKGFTARSDLAVYRDVPNAVRTLMRAAMCYAREMGGPVATIIPVDWPWDAKWWQPGTPQGNLARAGALIAAAIDVIQYSTKQA